MRKTTGQQSSSASPSCYPPGSLSEDVSADAPGCEAQEQNKEMEVKQVTLCQRSGNVKQHSKKEGVLTADVVDNCISNLGRTCTGLQYAYLHLSLPKRSLSDVSVLCNYVFLEKLELQHNKIKDLSCVNHMPNLLILDASHNEIYNFFGFQPPSTLKVVDFSHNHMTKMKELSACPVLSKLNLDYNHFTEIIGLRKCESLTHLSMANNRLCRISGLDTLPLKYLCLRGNQLETIEGLESLKSLQVLDLSVNRITSLSGLQNLHLLGSINLEKNLISEIQEFKHILDLLLLRDLNLLGNPVQERPDYRLQVVFLLQHLTLLDQEKVSAEEKVSSINKFDPPLEVVAARDQMTQLVYQMMQPQMLHHSTLPSADSLYPMLVLTGPQGCGKRELAHRLCQELSDFAYGLCHTTRGPYYGEEHGVDYHFVSEEEFQNMVLMGKFIQTMQYGGHRYGLTRDAVEDLAREGLACCVHMELEGVLSLKKSFFEPRYVLLIPTKVEKYMDQLKGRNLYTKEQIDTAAARIELYTDINRQRPGFFDNVILSDDFEEAFQSLKRVLNEYLLLDEQEEGENNLRPSDTAPGHEPDQKPRSPSSRSGRVTSLSALKPSNLFYRNHFTKIQSELSPQKSPAELASIRRREQLVRETIAGRRPEVYSHLFKSSAQTAPSSVQNQDAGDPPSEGSSSDKSRTSSALSVPSSAGALSGLVEPLDISVPGKDSETPKGQTPENPPSGTDHPASALSSSSCRRPGSDAKAVLPPIPTGHKIHTVSSPVPSPHNEPKSTD